ncbi:hypothetical protein, partial [Microvirga aerilata]|uniref:hypothetical protein n=1 Tax=Microvirga aerilata TaxID=670292 RepID=UPI001AEE26A0
MEGRRHSKKGPFLELRTHWRAELAEAVSSVIAGGNNRSVSHVSQPQDGPEWVEAVSKRERAAPWSNLISCKPQYAAESPVHERELVKIVHRG